MIACVWGLKLISSYQACVFLLLDGISIKELLALVQETGGSELLIPVVCVAIVSRVVTPRETLAGTALASSQNDTHDTMTSMQHGM